MIANNTGIRHLFNLLLRQYSKLIEKKAYLNHYASFDMFNDGQSGTIPDEFNEAQAVVKSLSEEYEALEKTDYVRFTYIMYIMLAIT